MPTYISYEESKERCRNILCHQCGRTLRPLKIGDYEKRFCHLTCIDKYTRELQRYETERQWEKYMREHSNYLCSEN